MVGSALALVLWAVAGLAAFRYALPASARPELLAIMIGPAPVGAFAALAVAAWTAGHVVSGWRSAEGHLVRAAAGLLAFVGGWLLAVPYAFRVSPSEVLGLAGGALFVVPAGTLLQRPGRSSRRLAAATAAIGAVVLLSFADLPRGSRFGIGPYWPTQAQLASLFLGLVLVVALALLVVGQRRRAGGGR